MHWSSSTASTTVTRIRFSASHRSSTTSGAKVAPILFTWPSRASVFDYNYDKESTNYSRVAFEQTLRTLAKDPDVKDITVMAHSMGTWLAMESLAADGDP